MSPGVCSRPGIERSSQAHSGVVRRVVSQPLAFERQLAAGTRLLCAPRIVPAWKEICDELARRGGNSRSRPRNRLEVGHDMLRSWLSGEDTGTVREHDNVAPPQSAVGEKFGNGVRDLARSLGLERHLDRGRIDPDDLWTAVHNARLKTREHAVGVGLVQRRSDDLRREQPEEPEEILSFGRHSAKCQRDQERDDGDLPA